MLKEPRRKYLDYAFLAIIVICLGLLLAYQVTNVVEISQEPTPTPTRSAPSTPFQQSIPEVGEEVFRPSPTPDITSTPTETPIAE